MDSDPTLSTPETAAATLRLIVRGLLAVLGSFGLEPMQGVILYGRINAIVGRIERMLIRFRAGRLWRRTERAQIQGRRGRAVGRGPALPRKFGWLVQAGGYQAVGFGLQLQTLLNTPEMGVLLAASPEAGRLLRPLCRALAIDLNGTVAAPRESPPPCGSAPIRRRKPRPKPEPFRIPLPRGALSWARREGFGKMR